MPFFHGIKTQLTWDNRNFRSQSKLLMLRAAHGPSVLPPIAPAAKPLCGPNLSGKATEMSVETALLALLDANQIAWTLHEHAAVFTVEESTALHAAIAGAHTKNLFLKDTGGAFWLVTVPHDISVDLKALAPALGARKFSFAKADDLLALLGLTPGSVTPLAAINDGAGKVGVALDQRLAQIRADGFAVVHDSAHGPSVGLALTDGSAALACTGAMGPSNEEQAIAALSHAEPKKVISPKARSVRARPTRRAPRRHTRRKTLRVSGQMTSRVPRPPRPRSRMQRRAATCADYHARPCSRPAKRCSSLTAAPRPCAASR